MRHENNYHNILSEYEQIKKNIREINEAISKIKNDIKNKINNADSEYSKRIIYLDYQLKMNKIKNNEQIKKKYQMWKKKLAELEQLLKNYNDNNYNNNYNDNDDSNSNIINGININSIYKKYGHKSIDLSNSHKSIDSFNSISKKKKINIVLNDSDKRRIVEFYNNLVILKDELTNQLDRNN